MKVPEINKTFFFLVFSLVLSQSMNAQTVTNAGSKTDTLKLYPGCDLTKGEEETIFSVTNMLPAFRGGQLKWINYSNKNFDFESVIQLLNDTIKFFQDSLLVEFIVTKNGKICNINVVKGNTLLAEPVKKLLSNSPAWIPGVTSAGNYVNSFCSLRIGIYINRMEQVYELRHSQNLFFRDIDK